MAKSLQAEDSPFCEDLAPEDLAAEILASGACGLTVSGGEPFAQAAELERLLRLLARAGMEDIIIYSGLRGEGLLRGHPWLPRLAGCLIDGPFMRDQPTEAAWKGSAQQRAWIFKNPSLYSGWLQSSKGSLQAVRRGGALYLVGIPRIGDAEKLLGTKDGSD